MPPAILLMGPTASGKTGIAVELVQRFPFEIISVDSALVYRHMNIGTAKPDAATLALAPHHLIDIIEPTERYSAAQFCRDAQHLMAEISARGNIPLLVGGTMLYFKALREGLSDLPEADREVRAVLDARAAEIGWPGMHAELARVDPETAARLQPTDPQRIQRALEVYELTGEAMSSLMARGAPEPLSYRTMAIGLMPSDRAILHQRIADRFDAMLVQGLIEEVKWLREHYALNALMPSMRCVGYRQAWQYLDGEFDRDTLRDKGLAATRQLAKRQMTWLRGMGDVRVMDCLDAHLFTQINESVKAFLQA